MSSKLKSLSFFSGCLGLDIGLENVDIENILFCENDKFCKETISKNKPEIPLIDDILKYSSEDIKKLSGLKKNQKPDLIVGDRHVRHFQLQVKGRVSEIHEEMFFFTT